MHLCISVKPCEAYVDQYCKMTNIAAERDHKLNRKYSTTTYRILPSPYANILPTKLSTTLLHSSFDGGEVVFRRTRPQMGP